MSRRKELHALLKSLMAEEDRENVYFQPPESIRMTYPAIVYHRESGNAQFADDHPYALAVRYRITVIDKNPDSYILDRVAKLPMTLFSRHYTADNLNHDVFNTYI